MPASPSSTCSTPLVSVCMPCHNAGHHILEALQSVFDQTYPEIEIIAVCDSSTDNTGTLLESAARGRRLQVIQATLGSAAKSRNLAFAHSRGEYIKYFDADDVLSPDLIENQVVRLQGHSDCIASAQWKRFHTQLDEREFEPDGTWQDLDSIDWLVESARDGGVHAMMQCGMFLIPRPLLELTGGWDERLTLIDDTEFFGRLFCASRQILFTTGALYYRSGLEGSLSAQKSRSAWESAVLSVEGFSRSLLSREESERTRRVAADLCQTYCYEIAPFQPDLGQRLQSLAREFGGSRIPPVGGPVFKAVSRLVGWSTAARLRASARGFGYAAWQRRFRELLPDRRRQAAR